MSRPVATPAVHSSDDEPVAGARAWFAIAILLLLTVLSFIDRGIISLMVDPIKRDLRISDFQVSLLQGFAFALFYATASLPMSWLSDRLSRRWVIYAGATLWSLATAAGALTRTFGQLFAARIAVGAGEATLSPAAYALVSDLFPKRQLALAIGVLAAGSATGGALAFVLGGFIVAWAQSIPPVMGMRSWQLVFLVVGLPGLLIAPLVFLIRTPGHTPIAQDLTQAAPHFGAWLRSRWRYLVPLCLGTGFQATVAFGVSSWLPAYFLRNLGYDIATLGLTLGIIQGVTGIIGFVGGGWLVDRLARRNVANPHSAYLIAVSGLTTVVGVAAFGVDQSITSLLVLLAILYLLMPFTGPALAQLHSVTPRIYRARAIAVYMLTFNLMGMTLGPSSVALLTENVLGGPQHVGGGIALTTAIYGPLAVLSLWLSGRAIRRLAPADTAH